MMDPVSLLTGLAVGGIIGAFAGATLMFWHILSREKCDHPDDAE